MNANRNFNYPLNIIGGELLLNFGAKFQRSFVISHVKLQNCHGNLPYVSDSRWRRSYNTIQILLSTPHGGFSETNINSTGNQKQTNKQKKYSKIVDKQFLRNNYYETICI